MITHKEFSMSFEGRDNFKREFHKAVCADCGQECEVPFKPAEGRPVYCRECFQKHRKPRKF
jgi:CxxC-x17-CxxC domain-containing protein